MSIICSVSSLRLLKSLSGCSFLFTSFGMNLSLDCQCRVSFPVVWNSDSRFISRFFSLSATFLCCPPWGLSRVRHPGQQGLLPCCDPGNDSGKEEAASGPHADPFWCPGASLSIYFLKEGRERPVAASGVLISEHDSGPPPQVGNLILSHHLTDLEFLAVLNSI